MDKEKLIHDISILLAKCNEKYLNALYIFLKDKLVNDAEKHFE